MVSDSNTIGRLNECFLFRNVDTERIAQILSEQHIRIRKFENNQYAAYAGEPCSDLPILVTGSVRGEMTEFAGKNVKIEDLTAPAVLASAFVFGNDPKYPVDIIANEPSVIYFIPRESLMKIFKENPMIMLNFLNDVSNRSQFLSRKIRFLVFRTIREKLAHYLIELSEKQKSDNLQIPIAQAKLAEFFGVARPSLGRTIAELDRKGIIKTDRNEVKILKKQKLIELAKRS